MIRIIIAISLLASPAMAQSQSQWGLAGDKMHEAVPVPYAAMQDCFDRRDITSTVCNVGCHYWSTNANQHYIGSIYIDACPYLVQPPVKDNK